MSTTAFVVVDHSTGDAFVHEVHENDNALDTFHHPYAYAADRRIDHRVARISPKTSGSWHEAELRL
jgi:hypothetical protein